MRRETYAQRAFAIQWRKKNLIITFAVTWFRSFLFRWHHSNTCIRSPSLVSLASRNFYHWPSICALLFHSHRICTCTISTVNSIRCSCNLIFRRIQIQISYVFFTGIASHAPQSSLHIRIRLPSTDMSYVRI